MPESRRRKKSRPQQQAPALATSAEGRPSPTWWVPVFVVLLVVGLAWVVITYVTDSRLPIPALGGWNLGIGFAFILVGFLMTMRWR